MSNEFKQLLEKIKGPVRYEHGNVVDRDGQTLMRANRESGTTPLMPFERDQLMSGIADLLNESINSNKMKNFQD